MAKVPGPGVPIGEFHLRSCACCAGGSVGDASVADGRSGVAKVPYLVVPILVLEFHIRHDHAIDEPEVYVFADVLALAAFGRGG